MARITVEDCIDKFPSRFELVLVASQRARKLHSGDEPTIDKDNDKNTVIALREIADSTLTVDEMKENLIQEYQTVTISDEEEENLEIESQSLDNDNAQSSNLSESEIKTNEIETELNDLVSSEDDEIKDQYEITENIDNNTAEDNSVIEESNTAEDPNDSNLEIETKE